MPGKPGSHHKSGGYEIVELGGAGSESESESESDSLYAASGDSHGDSPARAAAAAPATATTPAAPLRGLRERCGATRGEVRVGPGFCLVLAAIILLAAPSPFATAGGWPCDGPRSAVFNREAAARLLAGGRPCPLLKTDDAAAPTGHKTNTAGVDAAAVAFETAVSATEIRTDARCRITDFGAVDGNRSADARKNAAAIQAALEICERVAVPAGTYKIAPVTLPSNRELFLEAGSSLVGSDQWQDYGVTRFLPPMGRAQQLRPLLSATNASNISITGDNGTIDGNGWFAWPAANWSNAECGLHGHCAPDVFFGLPAQKLRPPQVLTFIRANDVTLSNLTIKNPGVSA